MSGDIVSGDIVSGERRKPAALIAGNTDRHPDDPEPTRDKSGSPTGQEGRRSPADWCRAEPPPKHATFLAAEGLASSLHRDILCPKGPRCCTCNLSLSILMRDVHLYNTQLPQSALTSRTPMQAMKNWYKSHPHLFVKSPRNHAGRDS